MGGAHADVSKHVKAYYMVFGALAVFTVITVAVSYFHFTTPVAIGVALLIASIKASLVARTFMHLKWERSLSIWVTLAFCAMFFIVLMLLPVLTTTDLPKAAHTGMWDHIATTGHGSSHH